MEISIHEIKDQVNVSIVLSSDNVLQPDDILMPRQLLQKDDLSEGSLRVCCILECIKVLFESHDVFGLLIYGLPHDTVSSLAFYNVTIKYETSYRVSKGFRTS